MCAPELISAASHALFLGLEGKGHEGEDDVNLAHFANCSRLSLKSWRRGGGGR